MITKANNCCKRFWRALLVFTVFLAGVNAHAGFSGDVILDATLGNGYTIRAGGSGGEISRSDVIKCNSVGADALEQTCPNDATYTPASASGGYQAWAVGVAHLNLTQREIECYAEVELVWNWWLFNWEFVLVFHCEEVTSTFFSGTLGKAAARVMWGTDELGTSPYWLPPGQLGAPTSIFAFYDNELTDCVPNLDQGLNPNLIDADCENPVDSNYVEEPGYEIEISFADPLCSIGFLARTHGILDKTSDCFYYYHASQVSTLPGAYQDTTLFDSGSTINIGFGSASADFIVPGFTYEVSQIFSSDAQPPMLGFPVTHTGAITTDICELNIGFNFGFDNLCHFAVDTASVGGVPDLFSTVTVVP